MITPRTGRDACIDQREESPSPAKHPVARLFGCLRRVRAGEARYWALLCPGRPRPARADGGVNTVLAQPREAGRGCRQQGQHYAARFFDGAAVRQQEDAGLDHRYDTVRFLSFSGRASKPPGPPPGGGGRPCRRGDGRAAGAGRRRRGGGEGRRCPPSGGVCLSAAECVSTAAPGRVALSRRARCRRASRTCPGKCEMAAKMDGSLEGPKRGRHRPLAMASTVEPRLRLDRPRAEEQEIQLVFDVPSSGWAVTFTCLNTHLSRRQFPGTETRRT